MLLQNELGSLKQDNFFLKAILEIHHFAHSKINLFFLYLTPKALGSFAFALQAKINIDISLEMSCQMVFASPSFLFCLPRVMVSEPGRLQVKHKAKAFDSQNCSPGLGTRKAGTCDAQLEVSHLHTYSQFSKIFYRQIVIVKENHTTRFHPCLQNIILIENSEEKLALFLAYMNQYLLLSRGLKIYFKILIWKVCVVLPMLYTYFSASQCGAATSPCLKEENKSTEVY